MSGGPSGGGGGGGQDVWWVLLLKVLAIFVLAFLSATFSGLDLGLMSLDPGQLEIVIEGGKQGNPIAVKNAHRAKRILPVRRDGNLLLCTVLLGNVAVNSCLAVLLDAFAGGIVGFVITTFLVVTFGEIVPQVVCHRHGLYVGSVLLPILKFFLYLFYPVNKPMALFLDRFFGQGSHSTVWNTDQMKSALDYQMQKDPGLLSSAESRLLKGALESHAMCVRDTMVPIKDAFCLDVRAVYDVSLLQSITEAGYSRLPVVDYQRDPTGEEMPTVIGLLHVKDLLVIDPNRALPLKTLFALFGADVFETDSDEPVLTLLRTFRKGTSQLACIKEIVSTDDRDPYWKHIGIITVQDILNVIIQADLHEQDEDVHKEASFPRIISNVSGMFAEEAEAGATMPVRMISKKESVAIQGYLMTSYPEIFQGFGCNLHQFITEDCTVVECTANQHIYTRGKPADFACLVLSGALSVFAGREGFKSVSGAWEFLAIENVSCASAAKQVYVPDFSAYAEEGSRLLMCTRASMSSEGLESRRRSATDLGTENLLSIVPVAALDPCRPSSRAHGLQFAGPVPQPLP